MLSTDFYPIDWVEEHCWIVASWSCECYCLTGTDSPYDSNGCHPVFQRGFLSDLAPVSSEGFQFGSLDWGVRGDYSLIEIEAQLSSHSNILPSSATAIKRCKTSNLKSMMRREKFILF